ncbi:MAG: glycosyltransferase, partial [Candidatus Latescibacterota bacterium]
MGDARQVHIARWAAHLIDSGYDVTTASLEPITGVPGDCKRIRIPSALPDFVRYPTAVPAVRRIIHRFKPGVINAHFAPNYGVIAAMSGFQPWVLSTWGSDIMLLPQRSAFHSARTRFVINRASYITSDADVMSERLVELGADPKRIITFPFGVDRNIFSPLPRTGTDNSDAPRVLSTRKIESIYNLDIIVAAWPEVAKSLDASTLTIAGTGSLAGKIREEAEQSGAARTIAFVGDITHDGMPRLLREHDIFLSIASSDTTSVSLLEAMACGLFPIVSDIPANREWIRHGENGLLVPPRDSHLLARAIVDAWDDRDLRDAAKKRNADL